MADLHARGSRPGGATARAAARRRTLPDLGRSAATRAPGKLHASVSGQARGRRSIRATRGPRSPAHRDQASGGEPLDGTPKRLADQRWLSESRDQGGADRPLHSRRGCLYIGKTRRHEGTPQGRRGRRRAPGRQAARGSGQPPLLTAADKVAPLRDGTSRPRGPTPLLTAAGKVAPLREGTSKPRGPTLAPARASGTAAGRSWGSTDGPGRQATHGRSSSRGVPHERCRRFGPGLSRGAQAGRRQRSGAPPVPRTSTGPLAKTGSATGPNRTRSRPRTRQRPGTRCLQGRQTRQAGTSSRGRGHRPRAGSAATQSRRRTLPRPRRSGRRRLSGPPRPGRRPSALSTLALHRPPLRRRPGRSVDGGVSGRAILRLAESALDRSGPSEEGGRKERKRRDSHRPQRHAETGISAAVPHSWPPAQRTAQERAGVNHANSGSEQDFLTREPIVCAEAPLHSSRRMYMGGSSRTSPAQR